MDSLLQPTLTSRAGAGGALGASCPSCSCGWLPKWRDHNPSGEPIAGTLCDEPHCKKTPDLWRPVCACCCWSCHWAPLGRAWLPPSSLPLGKYTHRHPKTFQFLLMQQMLQSFWNCFDPFLDSDVTSFLPQEAPAWPGCCIHSSPHFVEGRAPLLPSSSPASGLLSTRIHWEGMSLLPPQLSVTTEDLVVPHVPQ